MNIWTAWTTGFGIGLASIGGLWLTIRALTASARNISIARTEGRVAGTVPSLRFHALLAASQLLRLLLTAAGFYAVAHESAGFVVPAVAGFWVARRVLIRRWGGVGDA